MGQGEQVTITLVRSTSPLMRREELEAKRVGEVGGYKYRGGGETMIM
jgi:hypothetical protein